MNLVVIKSYRVNAMADKKVKFGSVSRGKQSVLHKHYEFVKHREYANERFNGVANISISEADDSLQTRHFYKELLVHNLLSQSDTRN